MQPDPDQSQRSATPQAAQWQIGEWRLDTERDVLTREVSTAGEAPTAESVHIEPRQTRLLIALAERAGEVLSAEDLLVEVWRDVVVTPDSVYQTIAKLRRALRDEPESPRYIETLPRKGYRLVASAEPLPLRRRASDSDLPSAPVTAEREPSPETSSRAPGRPPTHIWLTISLVAAIGAATLVGVQMWMDGRRAGTHPVEARTVIAVLPFVDGSASGADAVFAEGLTDVIGKAIQRIPDVRVAPSEAVVHLATAQAAPAEYASRLGVDILLRGTIERSGERVLVNSELVDGRTGERRGNVVFEQPRASMVRLPEEIAARVATTLGRKFVAPPEYATAVNVLWVDDNPDNNARERAALENFGVFFTVALTTEQALAVAANASYDLIISDMNRPPDARAGYTLLAELRAHRILTPFIIYTTECVGAHRLDAQSRGAYACVDRISEVMNAVISVLENRPAPTSGPAASTPDM